MNQWSFLCYIFVFKQLSSNLIKKALCKQGKDDWIRRQETWRIVLNQDSYCFDFNCSLIIFSYLMALFPSSFIHF